MRPLGGKATKGGYATSHRNRSRGLWLHCAVARGGLSVGLTLTPLKERDTPAIRGHPPPLKTKLPLASGALLATRRSI